MQRLLSFDVSYAFKKTALMIPLFVFVLCDYAQRHKGVILIGLSVYINTICIIYIVSSRAKTVIVDKNELK